MTGPSNYCPLPQSSGNMLVYILGAIFLMGVLVMVVKGNTQEGIGLDVEKATLRVTQVQAFGARVEAGINRILDSGRSESELRFAYAAGSGYVASHANYGSATSDTTRQVFNAAGGNVEFWPPPADILASAGITWGFYAMTHIKDFGSNNSSLQKAELLMVLPIVTENFCRAVNRANGQNLDLTQIMDTSTNGTVHAGTANAFAGTFVSGSGTNRLEDALFTKHPAAEACIRLHTGDYAYYRVLLAR